MASRNISSVVYETENMTLGIQPPSLPPTLPPSKLVVFVRELQRSQASQMDMDLPQQHGMLLSEMEQSAQTRDEAPVQHSKLRQAVIFVTR